MREKLIDLAHNYFDSVPWYADIADLNPEELTDHLIANGVTIPVRCENCRYYKYGKCRFWDKEIHPDNFCSYGERKDNDCT